MWRLRVYDPNDDELVAEHELGSDQGMIEQAIGFTPTLFGSNPLNTDALRGLDRTFVQLRRPGRESWHGRALFLDYDADSVATEDGHGRRDGTTATRKPQPANS